MSAREREAVTVIHQAKIKIIPAKKTCLNGKLATPKNALSTPSGQVGRVARLHAEVEVKRGHEFAFCQFELYFLVEARLKKIIVLTKEIQLCNVMVSQRR